MTVCGATEVMKADLSSTVVVRALAAELDAVVADCRALEFVVAEIFSSLPQGHLLTQLQAFDLIIQKIENCTTVLEAVADHAPVNRLSADQIIGGVSLSALAIRLSGQIGAIGGPSGEAEIW